jgi:hypothetical protein
MTLRILIRTFLAFGLLVPSAVSRAQTSTVDDGLLPAATANAEDFLHHRFTKCGEDYFSKHTYPDNGFTPAEPKLDTVYQYKGWSWYLEPEPLALARRLNGIDWKAEVVVTFTAVREHVLTEGGFRNPHWLMWGEAGKASFGQQLKGGNWTIYDISYFSGGWVSVSCSEVQRLLEEDKTAIPDIEDVFLNDFDLSNRNRVLRCGGFGTNVDSGRKFAGGGEISRGCYRQLN